MNLRFNKAIKLNAECSYCTIISSIENDISKECQANHK